MDFIIDRKKKRFKYGMDVDWVSEDSLGIKQAHDNHAKEIAISKDTDNIIEKFLLNHNTYELMGKKIFALKDDNSRMFTGYVRDVYPDKILLVKVNGENMPLTFKSIISMEEA